MSDIPSISHDPEVLQSFGLVLGHGMHRLEGMAKLSGTRCGYTTHFPYHGKTYTITITVKDDTG